jgi:hypothetical protein
MIRVANKPAAHALRDMDTIDSTYTPTARHFQSLSRFIRRILNYHFPFQAHRLPLLNRKLGHSHNKRNNLFLRIVYTLPWNNIVKPSRLPGTKSNQFSAWIHNRKDFTC